MKLIKCQHCDAEYSAQRISRKYCSDSCRSMAYRQRIKYRENAIIMSEMVVKDYEERQKLKRKAKADFEYARQLADYEKQK